MKRQRSQVRPEFQMPFYCHQTWRASTYNGHAPNQNSIDLVRVDGGSLNEAVYASFAGTVTRSEKGINEEGKYYGYVIDIEHGGGWVTQCVHLSQEGAIPKGTKVVRGQRIGKIGKFPDFPDMAPHLHYVQLKNRMAVRVHSNGTAIAVHKGAEKPDKTYPTEDLTSHNCPGSCTLKTILGGASVTCKEGTGQVRAVVECLIPAKQSEYVRRGPWVEVGATSTASCVGGHNRIDYSYEHKVGASASARRRGKKPVPATGCPCRIGSS